MHRECTPPLPEVEVLGDPPFNNSQIRVPKALEPPDADQQATGGLDPLAPFLSLCRARPGAIPLRPGRPVKAEGEQVRMTVPLPDVCAGSIALPRGGGSVATTDPHASRLASETPHRQPHAPSQPGGGGGGGAGPVAGHPLHPQRRAAEHRRAGRRGRRGRAEGPAHTPQVSWPPPLVVTGGKSWA